MKSGNIFSLSPNFLLVFSLICFFSSVVGIKIQEDRIDLLESKVKKPECCSEEKIKEIQKRLKEEIEESIFQERIDESCR